MMQMSAWPLLVMAGLAVLVHGSVMSFLRRDRVDAVIVWGGLADAGLVLIGFGLMSPAGMTGGILTLFYHALARLLAWVCLHNLTPRGTPPTSVNLRGALRRKPVQATLLVLGIIASFDVSALVTPEGRHYVLHAAANDGSLWLAVAMGIPSCLLTWIAARPILAICFDDPDETRSLPGKDGSRIAWLLALALAVIGLSREHGIEIGAWLAGTSVQALPLLEEPWPWAVCLLYAGAFVPLVRRLMTPRVRDMYVVGLCLLSFILIAAGDVTPLARLFGLIVTGIGTLVACYSCGYIHNDDSKRVYWFLLLLTFAALLGIVTADNLGSLVMFWELMSWASFFLVAWEATDKARSAALKYLVICCGGAYFMIPGLFVLAGQTPTLAGAVASVAVLDPLTLRLALVCVILGAAAKAGLVPLHFWLPDAHPAAPSSVSAPLSGVLTKMGVFVIFLALYLLAGESQLARTGTGLSGLSWPGSLTVLLGVTTMFFGEWRALLQDDIKRILAYSTMGQVGEIVTVLGLGTWLSSTAGLTHALNHAIMKDLLFLGAGVLILRLGSRTLSDMSGLVRRMPWTVGCMAVGLVSLMGLPPFNGFVSKYLMIVACMEAGKPFLAVLLLAAGLMGAVYYLRILRVLVLDAPHESHAALPGLVDPPWSMRLPLVILAGLCVGLGLFPSLGPSLVEPIVGVVPGRISLVVEWPVYVLIPMLGACVPILLRHDARLAAKATAGVLFAASLAVMLFGRDLDPLAYGMVLLAPLMGGLNMVYALGYMEHSHSQWRFYTFFLLMTGGLMGVAASSSLFGFFTFWEIMSSWTLYFAIAHEGTPQATRAAFKYFLFNLAGAGFLFLGIGLAAGMLHVNLLADIHGALQQLDPHPAAVLTTLFTALLAAGFVLKAAQVSLRIDWQMHPAEAPTPVSGFISSVLLKIAIFGLIKLFAVFSTGLVPQVATISHLVAWAGAFTILYGACQAMMQNGIKLVFIWSTVSQLGYMVVALTLGTSLGLAGTLLHMVNHMLFKDLLFLTAGALMFAAHAENLSDLGGLGRRMPITMTCFGLAAMAAVGVPPTNGFTSKWLIYQALMQEGQVALALVCLVGSVLTLTYLLRFLHIAFFGQAAAHMAQAAEVPRSMYLPMSLLAGGILLTGIFPGLLLWPINAVLDAFSLPRLGVGLGGLTAGPGAWNAPGVALLIFLALGGSWWLMRRLTVGERLSDIHAGGIDPAEDGVGRMPPQGMYTDLAQLLRLGPSTGSPDAAAALLPRSLKKERRI